MCRAARFRGSFRSLSLSTRSLYGHRHCIYLAIGASFSDESFISWTIAKPAVEPQAPETWLAETETTGIVCRYRSLFSQSLVLEMEPRNLEKNFLALARKAKAPDGNRRREREREEGGGERNRDETYIGIYQNITGIARFIVDCRLSFRLTIHSISVGTILYTWHDFWTVPSLLIQRPCYFHFFFLPFLSSPVSIRSASVLHQFRVGLSARGFLSFFLFLFFFLTKAIMLLRFA